MIYMILDTLYVYVMIIHCYENDNSNKEETCPRQRPRREDTQLFNIREHCFICGCPGSRSHELTQICTGTGSSTREKVLKAAEERHDEEVKLRMISYPDLFAYDAKYHRKCYAHYISEKYHSDPAKNFEYK